MSNYGPTRLSPMQELFVTYYEGDATEAAKRAGYKQAASEGSRLTRNTKIITAIRAKQEERSIAEVLGEAEIMRGLSEIVRDPEADNRDKLRAYELLGKRLALWTDKSLVCSLEEQLRAIPDEELDRRIQDGLERLQVETSDTVKLCKPNMVEYDHNDEIQ